MTNELSTHQAAVVKALLAQSCKIQDIAALFGVNQRAISQIKAEECYRWVQPNFDHGIATSEITTPKIQLIKEFRQLKGYLYILILLEARR